MRLWTIVLEISVMMAQFPSKEIARRSYAYRTLGLGYANLGGLLMSMGIAYDSAAGRAIGGAVTALLTGASYATSAEMAGELGLPSPALPRTARRCCGSSATIAAPRMARSAGYEGLSIPPVRARCGELPGRRLVAAARAAGTRHWRSARSTASATPRRR